MTVVECNYRMLTKNDYISRIRNNGIIFIYSYHIILNYDEKYCRKFIFFTIYLEDDTLLPWFNIIVINDTG